jgi:hypothetical protein
MEAAQLRAGGRERHGRNVPMPARSSDFAVGEASRDETGAAAAAVEPRTSPAATAVLTSDLRVTI